MADHETFEYAVRDRAGKIVKGTLDGRPNQAGRRAAAARRMG